MADQPALTRVQVELTAAELAMIQDAAGREAPATFIRVAALLQAQVLAAGGPPPEVGEGEPDHAPPQATPRAGQPPVPALDTVRLDRLERGLGELLAWVKTLACELYGHTGFRDAAHETAWRQRAAERFRRKEQEIQAWLDGGAR
jgi:hypothetical protein